MTSIPTLVHSDPDIMGGVPVFVGTRVPLQNLLDYLDAGDPMDEFIDDFPSVSYQQVVAALWQMEQEWEEFRKAAAYALQKNAELYRRLA